MTDDSLSSSDWSESKRKAWETIDTTPNAFYYRFLPPGEVQAKGKWRNVCF